MAYDVFHIPHPWECTDIDYENLATRLLAGKHENMRRHCMLFPLRQDIPHNIAVRRIENRLTKLLGQNLPYDYLLSFGAILPIYPEMWKDDLKNYYISGTRLLPVRLSFNNLTIPVIKNLRTLAEKTRCIPLILNIEEMLFLGAEESYFLSFPTSSVFVIYQAKTRSTFLDALIRHRKKLILADQDIFPIPECKNTLPPYYRVLGRMSDDIVRACFY